MELPVPCDWEFPPVHDWPDDDVVVLGADLQPATILHAYSRGLFPMYVDHRRGRDIGWWSPVRRGIIPLDGLRVTRSLRRSTERYTCTLDTDFAAVVSACATVHDESGNWITPEIEHAYGELHRLGHAHSIEVRDGDGVLVGGLYGLRINGLFAGESMFHTATDASKVALVHLVGLMRLAGMSLLDTQWRTDHLATLGCTEVSRTEYLTLLERALAN